MGVRRGQATLRLANVRTPSQQIDRHANRNPRRERRERPRPGEFPGHIFRKMTEQDGDRMTASVNLRGKRRGIGLQGRQLPLRQADVHFIGEPAAKARLREIQIAARGGDIFPENDKLALLRPHVEISVRGIGCDYHEHPVARILESFGVGGLRFDFAPDFAEKIELPGRVDAARLVDAPEAGRVFRRPQRLCDATLRFVRPRANAAARGRPGNRKRLIAHDSHQRSRRLQTLKSNFEIQIGFQSASDQQIELPDHAARATIA